MAVSTFHGLEVARRGMMTQQAALYTTGHNIANANTPGYTRQRVNFEQTEPYPPASRNRPQIPGQMGTGVQAGDIQRIRDSFVDMQFRGENSKTGYWQAKSEMLTQMEDIMNEPSDTGLAKTMDEFWNALQDLAVQPQNDGARRVVRQRGIALADTFNYMHDSLKAVQKDYRNEIDISQKRINSLLRQINQLNKQIGSIEPHGYLPNDLYDERDRLVDELSSYVNIKVDVKKSGGNASENAEGLYNIYLTNSQGDILKDSSGSNIKLIDAVDNATGTYNHTAYGINVRFVDRTLEDSPVKDITFLKLAEQKEGFVVKDAGGNETIIEENSVAADDANNLNPTNIKHTLDSFSAFNTSGQLRGYIEGYGYLEGSVEKGLFNEMLANLDEMAFTFAKQFNLVHQSGWSLNEISTQIESNYDFFSGVSSVKGAAGNISVDSRIIEDVGNIAASAEGNVVSGSFKRDTVDNATVGEPVFSGVYDSTNGTASDNSDDLNANASKFKIELIYDEVDAGSSEGTWSYKVTSYDENNNVLDDPALKSVLTGNLPANGIIKLYGIEIDTTLVAPKDDDSGQQTWNFTFSTKGVKSTDEAFVGNGSNALALANVKDEMLNYGGSLTNVHTFYQGMIGSLGDQASEAVRMENTATTLKDSVEQRRMSISNVSLDEEMTNMIKFQHAYNAAARQITLIDEMLDKIINGMGLVGR